MQPAGINKLRSEISRIEGRTASFTRQIIKQTAPSKISTGSHGKAGEKPVWSLGPGEIDKFFTGGLSPWALHEISPLHHRDSVAALAFGLALLSRRTAGDQRSVPDPAPPGVAASGERALG